MGAKKLSVIIPAFNEAKTIRQILQKIMDVELVDCIEKEIIVINDYSSDNTKQIVEDFMNQQNGANIYLINQPKNFGKGEAIHKGIEYSTGDYIIIQDADLEYNPAEFNILIQPIHSNIADVVYGSRFMGGKPHRILFFWHSIGNKFLTFLSNIFTNLNLTDMETCYKIFRSEIIKKIKLREKRFGFEPEVTAKIARIPGIRIYEVGISYYGRTYNDGKKIKARDGLKALWCILKYNLFAGIIYKY